MYTLTFDGDDMALIERAIAELPYRLAAPLVNRINSQLAASNDAASEPVPEPSS